GGLEVRQVDGAIGVVTRDNSIVVQCGPDAGEGEALVLGVGEGHIGELVFPSPGGGGGRHGGDADDRHAFGGGQLDLGVAAAAQGGGGGGVDLQGLDAVAVESNRPAGNGDLLAGRRRGLDADRGEEPVGRRGVTDLQPQCRLGRRGGRGRRRGRL